MTNETMSFYGYSDDTVYAEMPDGSYKDAGAFDHPAVGEVTAPDGSKVLVVGIYAPMNAAGSWAFGIMQARDDERKIMPLPEWIEQYDNPMFMTNDDPDYSVRMYLEVPAGSKFRWLGEDE